MPVLPKLMDDISCSLLPHVNRDSTCRVQLVVSNVISTVQSALTFNTIHSVSSQSGHCLSADMSAQKVAEVTTHHDEGSTVQPRPRPAHLVLC